MPLNTLREYAEALNSQQGIAQQIFAQKVNALNEKIDETAVEFKHTDKWEQGLQIAEKDIFSWSRGGKKQAYTPESLVNARIARDCANHIERESVAELLLLNTQHQAAISLAFLTHPDLFSKMVSEGKEGKIFGLVEMTDRLGPAIQPTGSSNYYAIKYTPYGIASRAAIGEEDDEKVQLVSATTAEASAKNLSRLFGVYYALAETSTAPRNDVPKSGRISGAYISTLEDSNIINTTMHEIPVLFRAKFDSIMRELMYFTLCDLYLK